MKVLVPALFAALVLGAAGCSSSPSTPAASPPSGAASSGAATAAPSPSPAPGGSATNRRAEALFGLKEPAAVIDDEQERVEDSPSTFVDPKTGEKVMRIPKSAIYYVRNGRLFNAIVNDNVGLPLVSEPRCSRPSHPRKRGGGPRCRSQWR